MFSDFPSSVWRCVAVLCWRWHPASPACLTDSFASHSSDLLFGLSTQDRANLESARDLLHYEF
jgi:hypothetical protein